MARQAMHDRSQVLTKAAMWEAVVARDAAFDGRFVYSVTTTGIYCRPSCGARLARCKNVGFHDGCTAAEAEGFRACKRCKPNQAPREAEHVGKVAAACRMIETAEAEPTLAELAACAGLSIHHFHRVFKAIAGVTPKAYANAHRQNRVRRNLPRSATVTDAIYASGFKSSGRFYADATGFLGMSPLDFRDGGANAVIWSAVTRCSLGAILVAATDKGVCAVLLGETSGGLKRDLQARFPSACITSGDSAFDELVTRVVAFVERPTAKCDLPLDIRGTAFQHRVWRALRQIPPGSTANYAEIADKIGKPSAVRAVAGACAANPVAVVVPCHRVVRSDGALSGYRWGVSRKRMLLDRERKE